MDLSGSKFGGKLAAFNVWCVQLQLQVVAIPGRDSLFRLIICEGRLYVF
jgi:hypothetical protein